MSIETNLQSIQHRITRAAERSGRDFRDIKLVAVSKTISLEKIINAVHAGALILGENKIQEAKDKITNYELQITNATVEWHLIGNLQKNKANAAVQLFDLIHSVDSAALAETLNRHAGKIEKLQRVLVQVKLADEATKHGVKETEFIGLLKAISDMENLKLEGIMTIPPFFADPEQARPYFRRLRHLAERARENGLAINELSMGMSNDFEIAIEEGATLVRVGTAIFGERTYL
jgi:pyridoxal phosphate enzyme (YggS family)